LEENFLHLTGLEPIGVHKLITTGIKNGFHAFGAAVKRQATVYRLSPANAVVDGWLLAGQSTWPAAAATSAENIHRRELIEDQTVDPSGTFHRTSSRRPPLSGDQ
jgi:hypothetical protein